MKAFISFLLMLLISCTGKAQLDSATIPVRLSYFEAGTVGSTTTLRWKTVCYLEYASFEIQKSTDGVTYLLVNSFTADRLRCQQPFDYIDNNTNAASRIFYRINVGNIDGKAYQSKIISVFISGKGVAINSFSPTIVNRSANISISAGVSQVVKLSVINIQGVVVKQQAISLIKGASNYPVSMEELQRGKYQAVFETQLGERNSISFIKQ